MRKLSDYVCSNCGGEIQFYVYRKSKFNNFSSSREKLKCKKGCGDVYPTTLEEWKNKNRTKLIDEMII